mmetsp:Transcript_6454/g.19083  ORF Transcript_6454/g.19083 Transcript_6454/m.19083 type:complete len:202 (+) Transcript_6454:225-830(+)
MFLRSADQHAAGAANAEPRRKRRASAASPVRPGAALLRLVDGPLQLLLADAAVFVGVQRSDGCLSHEALGDGDLHLVGTQRAVAIGVDRFPQFLDHLPRDLDRRRREGRALLPLDAGAVRLVDHPADEVHMLGQGCDTLWHGLSGRPQGLDRHGAASSLGTLLGTLDDLADVRDDMQDHHANARELPPELQNVRLVPLRVA